MQAELESSYPILDIQIVGLNEAGSYEVANDLMTADRSLPWLQDVDANNNQISDVWYDQWNVTYRDVIIADGQNQMVDVYNLTQNNLNDPDDYATMREKLIDAAMTEQKPWQNQRDRFDINDDGHVVPFDVLLMVNDINDNGARKLEPPTGTTLQAPYFDCNGDNFIAPVDVLQVVNEVEARFGSNGAAEGEASAEQPSDEAPVYFAEAFEDVSIVISSDAPDTNVITSVVVTPSARSALDKSSIESYYSDEDRSSQVESRDDNFWAEYWPGL